ncbi:MAG: HNH endonuclease [Pseudomonadota bacterium]
MLKVVRRDDHVCQECFTYVRDDEIEFDHVIPVSRGGPTSVENLRLLCRRCNNAKSDHIDGLLIDR